MLTWNTEMFTTTTTSHSLVNAFHHIIEGFHLSTLCCCRKTKKNFITFCFHFHSYQALITQIFFQRTHVHYGFQIIVLPKNGFYMHSDLGIPSRMKIYMEFTLATRARLVISQFNSLRFWKSV